MDDMTPEQQEALWAMQEQQIEDDWASAQMEFADYPEQMEVEKRGYLSRKLELADMRAGTVREEDYVTVMQGWVDKDPSDPSKVIFKEVPWRVRRDSLDPEHLAEIEREERGQA